MPPGPWKLPLIGNIHQIIGSHPHHILRDLANKHGPLIHLQLGEISNIVISSPEIVKEIYKSHDVVVSNRYPQLSTDILSYDRTSLIFSSYGSHWRQLRKICTLELLTAKRVQSFRHIREEEVRALIKKISESEGSVINLSRRIFSLTNNITARAAFGEKSEDQEKFLDCLDEAVRLMEGFSIADLYPSIKVLQMISGLRSRILATQKELDKILENIIRDHKDKNGNKNDEDQDLVDIFLKIQQQDTMEAPLTIESIKGVLLVSTHYLPNYTITV